MFVREPDGPTCMTSPSDVEANTPRSPEAGHIAMTPSLLQDSTSPPATAEFGFNGDVPVRSGIVADKKRRVGVLFAERGWPDTTKIQEAVNPKFQKGKSHRAVMRVYRLPETGTPSCGHRWTRIIFRCGIPASLKIGPTHRKAIAS